MFPAVRTASDVTLCAGDILSFVTYFFLTILKEKHNCSIAIHSGLTDPCVRELQSKSTWDSEEN